MESLNHISAEAFEARTLRTSQNTHKLWRQFKGCCLKAKTLSRSISENEAKVDVDKVTFFVQN